MFKAAKRKIVISIMSILAGILIATLGLIYLTSYISVTRDNLRLLEERANTEVFQNNEKPHNGQESSQGNGQKDFTGDNNDPSGEMKQHHEYKSKKNMELRTFYTVVLYNDGTGLVSYKGAETTYSNEQLIDEAIAVKEKTSGKSGDLLYYVKTSDDCITVYFMDNTSFTESFSRLFIFTLIFGLAAMVILFLVSMMIAGRIVKPMEESYLKEKQFTSDAGHELKTPISAVSANAEILRREIGDNKWLDNIVYENERMKALVTSLLELAKNENTEFTKEELNLSDIIMGTVLPFEAGAYEKGITFNQNIEENIKITGNRIRIEQLFTILTDNAVSHSKPSSSIDISMKQEKHNACIVFSNPCDPVSEENLKHLFERFYRNDEARSETGHYGLGLSIAKSIAVSHNGTISAKYNNGAITFTVKLPLK